jgi:hypothetical protein
MIDTLIGAAVELAADDRQIDLQRPSRGAYASVVRESARVPSRWRLFAACVLRRESGATLEEPWSGAQSRNPHSTASGRFQFLDSQWRSGLAHMVRERLVRHGLPAQEGARLRKYLAATPIHKWPAPLQDAGFNEVVQRGGWFHWRNGDHCDGLVPR